MSYLPNQIDEWQGRLPPEPVRGEQRESRAKGVQGPSLGGILTAQILPTLRRSPCC